MKTPKLGESIFKCLINEFHLGFVLKTLKTNG